MSQFTLSSSKWPAEDYELKLAEKANMTYRGQALTYRSFVNYYVTKSTQDWRKEVAPFQEQIKNNFLMVGINF